jgi:hypothetical protein
MKPFQSMHKLAAPPFGEQWPSRLVATAEEGRLTF